MIASRIDSSLASGFTQASLYAFVKQGFTNAGFTSPTDEYVSPNATNANTNDLGVVYPYVVDNTKSYGALGVRIA